MAIRVALDTTYAGTNLTGVGLYSRRLAQQLDEHAGEWGIELSSYGAAAEGVSKAQAPFALMQEWPTHTHGVLPFALLRNKPDIVHSTSHIGPLWGPGKLIVTVHDLIFMRYPEDYNRAWLATALFTLPKVLHRASAIIADSHATKADIERFFGVRAGKIVVVYPGIDRAYADAAANRNSRSQATNGQSAGPYILCLGPWVRRKNLEVIVEAFKRIAPRLPGLQLVITGQPARGMQGYTEESLLGDLPAQTRNRVRLMGYVPQAELYELVADASVLAYPSRWEGFGLPPLEAMLAGVPVVASLTPAVEEVTEGAAMLCDADNSFEWAKTLEIILRDAQKSAELSELGRRRAEVFTWERCARETAALYHRVARR
ncbi:MAG TPA: glycosyltransferase family 1 protein [Chloroflexia bacterium]|nr:glycosyltransferase family 1 protein [Chloroflexia bacterium]